MSRSSPVPARTVFSSPVHFLAFGFGSGLAPLAPGTAGTLAAIPSYLLLQGLPIWAYLAVTAAVTVVGIWLCGRSSQALGVHDHPGIVWDEIAGYLVTMAAAPRGWEWVLAGFILFRIFDVAKPWPCRLVDRQVQGGLGIMLDDIVAGIYGFALLQLAAYWLA